MWIVTVTLKNGQLFARQEFDCPGNAAEYALACREMGYSTSTKENEN